MIESGIDFRTLDQIAREPYEDAFLIGDLLTSRITILSGEPKAGKTLLAVALATALINGETSFLGCNVMRSVKKVVFGVTDDGAEAELKERFLGAVPDDSIVVFTIDSRRTGDGAYWQQIYRGLAQQEPGLFVLDNVLGSLPPGEDIASGTTASSVVSRIKPISQSGIPVLMVTHTPKAGEGFSVASAPIGGRAITAGARGVIALRRSKGEGLRIQTVINRAGEDLDLPVKVRRQAPDSEVPIWELSTPKRPARERRKESLDRWDALADQIVADQPSVTSMRALSGLYAPGERKAPGTVRTHLSTRVEHTATGWQKVGNLSLVA